MLDTGALLLAEILVGILDINLGESITQANTNLRLNAQTVDGTPNQSREPEKTGVFKSSNPHMSKIILSVKPDSTCLLFPKQFFFTGIKPLLCECILQNEKQ